MKNIINDTHYIYIIVLKLKILIIIIIRSYPLLMSPCQWKYIINKSIRLNNDLVFKCMTHEQRIQRRIKQSYLKINPWHARFSPKAFSISSAQTYNFHFLSSIDMTHIFLHDLPHGDHNRHREPLTLDNGRNNVII